MFTPLSTWTTDPTVHSRPPLYEETVLENMINNKEEPKDYQEYEKEAIIRYTFLTKKEYRKEYYLKHKDYFRKQHKEWALKNKEHLKEYR